MMPTRLFRLTGIVFALLFIAGLITAQEGRSEGRLLGQSDANNAHQAAEGPTTAAYVTNMAPVAAHVGVGREIVVHLSTQTAYAFEDGVLQRAVLVSTGLPATPTVYGDFRIAYKLPSQDLSGWGYEYPDVRWVMYFYKDYAFHSAYWHNNFGQPMSHGCVNMSVADAGWFYQFAAIGTPVHIEP